MKSLFAALCVVAVFSARATQPPAVSTEDQKDAAGAAWRECLVAQEPKYDDLTSDASTIAAALAPDCQQQFDAYMTVLIRGMPVATMRTTYASGDKARYDMALRIVLTTRAKRLKQ